MSNATFQELISTSTQAEIQAEIEAECLAAGLPVSSWTAGHVPKVLIAAFAKILEDIYLQKSIIAKLMLLDTSSGDGLSLLAFNTYGLDRISADFTEGVVVLSDAGGQGPYSIVANRHTIQAPNGLKYFNTTSGTLTRSGTLAVTWKAWEAGKNYNSVNNNSTWKFTVAPLAGVTLSNPAVGATGTWITKQGRDEESDELLRERCRDKWPTSGLGMTADAWEFHAKAASTSVTRVKVVTNPGSVAGLTRVLIAGVDGELSEEIVSDVDDILQPKKTICTTLEVVSADNRSVAILGTVYVKAAYLATVQDYVYGSDSVDSVLKSYQEEIPIGGTVYESRVTCALQDILKDVKAVEYVVITFPISTLALEDNETPMFDTSGIVITPI